MSQHVNKLTEAEIERLAILAEECSEVIKVINKIFRHGFESRWPVETGKTNRECLSEEIADVQFAIDMAVDAKDFDTNIASEAYERKEKSIKQFLHYN